MKFDTNSLVYEGDESIRLDKFLAAKMPEISRAKLQDFITEGQVFVDGKQIIKSSHKLETGQEIIINIPEETDGLPEGQAIPLNLIYQDENVVVINKPTGMVVHPGAGNSDQTLVNALIFRWPEIGSVGEKNRPGIVHRLDKETSGVLIVARNEFAYQWLVKQFKLRKTKKIYLALVDGHPPTPNGRIEAALGRDTRNRQKMAISYGEKGKQAVTEYHTIKSFRDHTMMEVFPHTGRTHQIRVHMAFLGCPVTGDKVYGHRKPSLPLDRFFLHAKKIEIILPGDKTPTEFRAPLPDELDLLLDQLEKETRV